MNQSKVDGLLFTAVRPPAGTLAPDTRNHDLHELCWYEPECRAILLHSDEAELGRLELCWYIPECRASLLLLLHGSKAELGRPELCWYIL